MDGGNFIRIIQADGYLCLFDLAEDEIEPRQTLYDLFYVFGRPRGVDGHNKVILGPDPSQLSDETSVLLDYIFGKSIFDNALKYVTTNDDLIESLINEFPDVPVTAMPSLRFALALAELVVRLPRDSFVEVISRWNAVADAINHHVSGKIESFETRGQKRRRLNQRLSPVELPELVRMIISQLPLRDKLTARSVNRVWNTQTTYTNNDLQSMLTKAASKGLVEEVDRLLQNPHVDPSKGVVMQLACFSGNLATVERLLQDPRVLQNSRFGSALYWAFITGNGSIIKRLLQDPRVDPAENNNELIRKLSREMSKHYDRHENDLANVELLLQDPRVDPSANDNEAVRSAYYRRDMRLVDLLLQDPRVHL